MCEKGFSMLDNTEDNVIFKLDAWIIIISFSGSPNYRWGEGEARRAAS
jgi:hypothetical protein